MSIFGTKIRSKCMLFSKRRANLKRSKSYYVFLFQSFDIGLWGGGGFPPGFLDLEVTQVMIPVEQAPPTTHC